MITLDRLQEISKHFPENYNYGMIELSIDLFDKRVISEYESLFLIHFSKKDVTLNDCDMYNVDDMKAVLSFIELYNEVQANNDMLHKLVLGIAKTQLNMIISACEILTREEIINNKLDIDYEKK